MFSGLRRENMAVPELPAPAHLPRALPPFAPVRVFRGQPTRLPAGHFRCDLPGARGTQAAALMEGRHGASFLPMIAEKIPGLLLQRRLAEYKQNPSDVASWEDVKQRILASR